MEFKQLLQFMIYLLVVLGCAYSEPPTPTLPSEEVQVLRIVGKTLKKTNWDFNVNPCDMAVSGGGWRNISALQGSEDSVTCNCSFVNGTICHVTSILLKTQDLQGSLPKELAGLPFLQNIDLARNYLSGSIPSEWGALPLVNITLLGNRLSGPIPKELGNIKTLESLNVEYNQLSGILPPELGGLSNLERLGLSSNQLKGKIPSSFSKLTKLKTFRISDNRFRGPIPPFIESWTQLEYLVVYASGLDAPLPPSISRLTTLKDLMISDMNGPGSSFPPIQNLKNLSNLVLRNINLTGELPSYLGTKTTNLKLLDLSFNKLRGVIPSSYEELRDVENIYLTGNMLNGSIPSWMPKERDGDTIDLSYNNFSEDLTTQKCVDQHMDQFAGSYTVANNSLIVFCLKNFQCPEIARGLHINCGGDEVTINGTTYEADNYDRKPLYYESSLKGWVLSNTGHFLDDHRIVNSTIWSDASKLSTATDPHLYASARLSALSLTYYAMCLQSGEYKVKLHFAEIMFSRTRSYKSLGRRYFDIYIQERLVWKDFNIVEEAGGVGKAIVKTFPVTISDGKLHIRLYWAGKGTEATPVKGVYGPLISAIAVDPVSPPKNGIGVINGGISLGAWIGIAVSVAVFLLLLIGGILWLGGCLRFKTQMERDFKSLDLSIEAFSLRKIKAATNNFCAANKIGEGGFGPVYKGMLSNGTAIAVKQLSEKSKQGNREFLNEIGVISALQHPHLVKLHGCCVEGDQLLLVYEFVDNNSLARALFGPEQTQISLDWPTRMKICLGIARGLAYIHEESRLKILHRDIKAANILLDKNLSPKISDFGLAKLYVEDESHISTTPAGTAGYLAPEYAMKGHLSHKSDVYSFGVLVMEIVCGKSNMTSRSVSTEQLYFVEWVRFMWKHNRLDEFVDSRLHTYDGEEAVMMVKVAILCTSRSPANRPLMSVVVKMLEGKLNAEMDIQLGNIGEEGEGDNAEAKPPDLMSIISEIGMEFDEQGEETCEEITEEEVSEISLLTWNVKGKEKICSSSL